MNIFGSMCAIATPFQASGRIDGQALLKLVDYQLNNGTQGLIVAGSTGEAHFLSQKEYVHLLTMVVDQVNGRVPVIAGAGEAGTAQSIEIVEHASACGVDGVLVVTPYYVRPTQDGLYRHFMTVADHSSVPVVVYNVPSRTSCDMQPETVARLQSHENIIAIKEAVGNKERIEALVKLSHSDFTYLSGDDYSALEAMLTGASGTISVVANLVPSHFRRLCNAACAEDESKASAAFADIQPLLSALQCAPNPISVKAGLAMLGLCDGSLRSPLFKLTDAASLYSIEQALRQLVPGCLAA